MKLLVSMIAFLTACGGGDGPGQMNMPDSAPQLDAPDTVPRIPGWKLEDVQPLSPRTGQTYGLDTFGGKVVVVVLLEGF